MRNFIFIIAILTGISSSANSLTCGDLFYSFQYIQHSQSSNSDYYFGLTEDYLKQLEQKGTVADGLARARKINFEAIDFMLDSVNKTFAMHVRSEQIWGKSFLLRLRGLKESMGRDYSTYFEHRLLAKALEFGRLSDLYIKSRPFRWFDFGNATHAKAGVLESPFFRTLKDFEALIVSPHSLTIEDLNELTPVPVYLMQTTAIPQEADDGINLNPKSFIFHDIDHAQTQQLIGFRQIWIQLHAGRISGKQVLEKLKARANLYKAFRAWVGGIDSPYQRQMLKLIWFANYRDHEFSGFGINMSGTELMLLSRELIKSVDLEGHAWQRILNYYCNWNDRRFLSIGNEVSNCEISSDEIDSLKALVKDAAESLFRFGWFTTRS